MCIILTYVHFLQGESKWKYRHNYYTENMGLFNWQSFVDIYFWITNIRNYLLVRDLEQRFYLDLDTRYSNKTIYKHNI